MQNLKEKIDPESGVSETIGFIIIFGLVMTGIALITLYGYPLLLQEQANANVKNMERNMIILQNDVKSLTYKNVPYQETTLQVSGGTLYVKEEPDEINGPYFEIIGTGTPIPRIYPGEIYFDSSDGQATVALENGAVHIIYRSSPNGSAMIADPRWYYDPVDSTYVLSFIHINASSDMSQTSIGSVKMHIVDSIQTDPIDIEPDTVTIKYYGSPKHDYHVAWYNYFKDPSLQMYNEAMPGFNTTTGILDSDAKYLVIKQYNVTILSI
jgi:hypothetical protein